MVTQDSTQSEIKYIYKGELLMIMIGELKQDDFFRKEVHICYYDFRDRLKKMESEFIRTNTSKNDTVINKVIQFYNPKGLLIETQYYFDIQAHQLPITFAWQLEDKYHFLPSFAL